MIRTAITAALEGQSKPVAGRTLALLASLPYKVAIDALGRMHDAGIVVRIGRKYSATWALYGSIAASPDDAFSALEALWRAGHPHPPRGEAQATPGRSHI